MHMVWSKSEIPVKKVQYYQELAYGKKETKPF